MNLTDLAQLSAHILGLLTDADLLPEEIYVSECDGRQKALFVVLVDGERAAMVIDGEEYAALSHDGLRREIALKLARWLTVERKGMTVVRSPLGNFLTTLEVKP